MKTAYTSLNKQQKLLCIQNYKHFFSKIIIRHSSIAVLGSIGFQNRFEKKSVKTCTPVYNMTLSLGHTTTTTCHISRNKVPQQLLTGNL